MIVSLHKVSNKVRVVSKVIIANHKVKVVHKVSRVIHLNNNLEIKESPLRKYPIKAKLISNKSLSNLRGFQLLLLNQINISFRLSHKSELPLLNPVRLDINKFSSSK